MYPQQNEPIKTLQIKEIVILKKSNLKKVILVLYKNNP